ncbi:hypothetical protein Deba_0471 [Desulfarculus baarsii DSM 2075]|uniref:Uncharacterized protein n=2 Tax=Desulfarculus baarsii TaxID=453230 RepID=E1QE58_DESB2|nr:hypothetical protein Deba_0471 [Desulfarculus baarsii DSM 2075]
MDQDITYSVSIKPDNDIRKIVAEQIKTITDYVAKLTEKPFENLGVSLNKVSTTAVQGTLSAIFNGEMDKIKGIWETTWSGMGKVVTSLFDDILGEIATRIVDSLGGALKSLFSPLGDWLGGMLKNVGASALSSVYGLFDGAVDLFTGKGLLASVSKTLGLNTLVSNVGSWLGLGSSAAGATAAGAAAITEAAAAFEAALTGTAVADAVTSALVAAGPWAEATAITEAVTAFEAALSGGSAATAAASSAATNIAISTSAADAASAAFSSAMAEASASIESAFSGGLSTMASATNAAGTAAASTAAAADAVTAALMAAGPGAEAAAIAEATAAFEAALSGGSAATAASTSAAASAGGLGAMGTTAVLAAPFAIGELVAAIMGETGPISAVIESIFGETNSPYTAQDAQASVRAGLESLSAGDQTGAAVLSWMTSDSGAGSLAAYAGWDTEDIRAMTQALGPMEAAMFDAQLISDQFSQALDNISTSLNHDLETYNQAGEAIWRMASEMGLSQAQIDALATSGQTMNQVVAAMATTAGDVRLAAVGMGEAIARAAGQTGLAFEQAQQFAAQAETLWAALQSGALGAEQAGAQLTALGQAMGLDQTQAESLTSRVDNLFAAMNQASGGSAELSAQLANARTAFGSLDNTIKVVETSTDSSTDSFLGLAEALSFANDASFDSGWLDYQNLLQGAAASAQDLAGQLADVAQAANSAQNGLDGVVIESMAGGFGVYHDGGLVGVESWPRHHGGLLPDETPAILQRGEAVIRRASVNAQTLPLLQEINRSGQAPPSAQNVSLHVEVHGNVMGDNESMEELARLIDQRLRRIAGGRYVA